MPRKVYIPNARFGQLAYVYLKLKRIDYRDDWTLFKAFMMESEENKHGYMAIGYTPMFRMFQEMHGNSRMFASHPCRWKSQESKYWELHGPDIVRGFISNYADNQNEEFREFYSNVSPYKAEHWDEDVELIRKIMNAKGVSL